MSLRVRNGLLVLLTAALMVVSVGCPNSTSITSGVGATQLVIESANPTRFETGFFNIDRLMVRPVDPNADQILGTARDLSLLPFGVFVDTAEPMVDPLFLDATQLSQGVYEVVEIRLSDLVFFDLDPTDPSTCESFQAFYFPPGKITVTNFAVPQQFTIVDGADTMFKLTFDLTQMMTTLNNAYTCSVGCGGFCISNFDPNQFAADTLDYLTFE